MTSFVPWLRGTNIARALKFLGHLPLLTRPEVSTYISFRSPTPTFLFPTPTACFRLIGDPISHPALLRFGRHRPGFAPSPPPPNLSKLDA